MSKLDRNHISIIAHRKKAQPESCLSMSPSETVSLGKKETTGFEEKLVLCQKDKKKKKIQEYDYYVRYLL